MLKIERIKSLLIIISLFASNCFCELPDANITSEKENGAANFTHESKKKLSKLLHISA